MCWGLIMSNKQKSPLFNPQAETFVLGGLLQKNDAFDDVLDMLTPDDFFVVDHRIIYQAICYLLTNAKGADWFTLSDFLKRQSQLDQIGGDVTIVNLIKNTPTAANIMHYANIVKTASYDRKMIEVAENIIANVDESVENRIDLMQRDALEIAEKKTTRPKAPIEYMPDIYAALMDTESRQKALGSPTGLSPIDNTIDGLAAGTLTIIAARPSMGKTVLATTIAEHFALNLQKTILFFSLEMNNNEIGRRLLSSLSRVPLSQIKHGQFFLDDEKKVADAYAKICNSRFIIDDSAPLTVLDIRAKSRRIKRQYGLDLIVIDYLQLIRAIEGENETIKLKYISNAIKILAKELNVPILALCQLNRDIERRQDKKPQMADIRQSGEIEQDADIIMFIDRPERYDDNAEKGLANIHIVKNRDGNIGEVKLSFHGEICRFENYRPNYTASRIDNSVNSFKNKFNYYNKEEIN